jgi:hypothetical protein
MDPSAALSFDGISLVQLAAVAAARAQGFSLEEALDIEGLEPAQYRQADVACKAQLADPAAGAATFAAYEKELARAEERLARRVRPIDEDLAAWVHFLGAYGAHPAPAELLAGLGLAMPDLARLGRLWAQKLSADASLRQRAEKLGREKPPAAPPPLRVEPARLVPSPDARPKPPPAPVEKKAEKKIEAPLQALDVPRPPPPPAVLPISMPLGIAISDPLASTLPVMSVPREPALPFAAMPPAAPEVAARPQVPDTGPRESLSGTMLAQPVPKGPALPFAGQQPAIPEALSGTMLAQPVPQGPALPFVEKERPQDAFSGTLAALPLPAGPAMPFAPAEPRPPEVHENAPAPADTTPREALSGTSLALPVPKEPALPFAPKARPEGLGETALLLEIPRDLIQSLTQKPAPPALTLEQHAAMTVEIVMEPARTAEVLARYGVTAAQREQMDRHYERVVHESEASRAAWHEAYRAHHARIVSGNRAR